MSFAETLLDSYRDRMNALDGWYSRVADECEKQVDELRVCALENGIKQTKRGDVFDIQFFRIDEPSNTHFRVVSSTGVLVVSFNDPSGHFGAHLHYFHSEELVDRQRFYTYKRIGSNLSPVQMDSEAEVEVADKDIAPSLLTELLFPTVSPARITPAYIQQLTREGRIG